MVKDIGLISDFVINHTIYFLRNRSPPSPCDIWSKKEVRLLAREGEAGCVIGEGSSGMKSPQESPLSSPSVNCSPDIQIISKLNHDQITWRTVLVALRKTTGTTQFEKGKLCRIPQNERRAYPVVECENMESV